MDQHGRSNALLFAPFIQSHDVLLFSRYDIRWLAMSGTLTITRTINIMCGQCRNYRNMLNQDILAVTV